jgi:anti-sigma factor RsiW
MESGFELQLLSAYVDEALDLPQQLEMQARLERDARLRTEVQILRQLRDAIRTHASLHAAPEELVVRIREPIALGPYTGARTQTGRIDWRRWFDWQPMVLALGVVGLAVWGMNLTLWQPALDESLMQAAVTSHLRATTGPRLVDVATTDRQAVAPWLSTRLAFSAPVLNADNADATLVGARIDSLDGRSAEALVYRLRDHIVDVFVLPMADDDGPVATASLRGFNVSHWSRGGLRYCVVSDLPRRQFGEFVRTLERVDDALTRRPLRESATGSR